MISPQWTSGDVPAQLLAAESQLNGSSCGERVAGARALANLADQWYSDGASAPAQRCIDLLCAYLRVRRYTVQPGADQAESAVREQITSLLTDFLRSGVRAVRGGILINLACARISGHHVFDGVTFGPGLRLILDGAQLEEGARLSFDGCHFQGCIVRLHRVSLDKHAVLSLIRSTVEPGAWLVASTASVHPTARVDVPGLTARHTDPAAAHLVTGTLSARIAGATTEDAPRPARAYPGTAAGTPAHHGIFAGRSHGAHSLNPASPLQ